MIEMSGIEKSFSGTKVLKGVDFTLRDGEIHALMGENGAGKSTMMKILAGIYSRNEGTVKVNGQEVNYTNPKQAEKDGIAVIHQELNILPELSIAENLFLGNEQTIGKTGWIKTKEMNEIAQKQLSKLGLHVKPSMLAKHLSVGQQQIVEIAKSLLINAKYIVMDEPTAALTDREIETLFETIDDLKKQGVSFVYISHRMEEIFAICDRITVLRDGASIGTKVIKETSFDEIVSMMVGRELGERFPERKGSPSDVKLEIDNLTREDEFDSVSLQVRAGEILGISGLMGAGRSELVETIFGYRQPDKGTIKVDGKPVKIKNPSYAMQQGVGFVSEDRKSKGLVVDSSIQNNLNMTSLRELSQNGWMLQQKEQSLYETMVKKLNIVSSSAGQLAKSLSGGNQQKVVIAKWLAINPKILILDEPTRGVDVGAKKEIYSIMNDLADQGVAIIMVSSELPEIIGMSTRVVVMCEGKHMATLQRSELSEEKIMHYATGGN
ncbi:sugar ABC transporter ATP-binding protein [Gracilibacillus lacisalsi]|uniref:sugar ABC transporter ATP-binding protein n=1 Tax=Gracilibacillus lacisalsi TaxID=393087 RepID=UPI000377FE15|nr:sugar ABC transporter ATP-binding protein [Gracilibacillus lacisalsi]